MKINIGLTEADRKEISDGLAKLLADTYTLYLKTQNYHWNVTGPMFQTLHLLFEHQYQDLAMAADTIAERIRTLGFPAPGSYKVFAELTVIEEETGSPTAEAMIGCLVKDHETLTHTAQQVLAKVHHVGDEPTLELLTHRMSAHEKAAWMLRSHLA